jgi:hypothetical protein
MGASPRTPRKEKKLLTDSTFFLLDNLQAGAENLIKEANNEAGLAALGHKLRFHLAMLAHDLNCG